MNETKSRLDQVMEHQQARTSTLRTRGHESAYPRDALVSVGIGPYRVMGRDDWKKVALFAADVFILAWHMPTIIRVLT